MRGFLCLYITLSSSYVAFRDIQYGRTPLSSFIRWIVLGAFGVRWIDQISAEKVRPVLRNVQTKGFIKQVVFVYLQKYQKQNKNFMNITRPNKKKSIYCLRILNIFLILYNNIIFNIFKSKYFSNLSLNDLLYKKKIYIYIYIYITKYLQKDPNDLLRYIFGIKKKNLHEQK